MPLKPPTMMYFGCPREACRVRVEIYSPIEDSWEGDSPKVDFRCPICASHVARHLVGQRVLVKAEDGMIIGFGETAAVDALTCIANAVIDIRNKYFAD